MKRRSSAARRRFVPTLQTLEKRNLLVGEVVELILTPRDANNELLAKDSNGVFTAQVGDIIELEVAYNDLRTPDSAALGIFKLGTDIVSSHPGVFVPLLKETQTFTIDSAFSDPAIPGDVTFGLEGSAETATTSLENLRDRPVFEISQALTILGFNASQFRVFNLSGPTGSDGIFQVNFVDDALANMDVANLSISISPTNPLINIPVQASEASPLNPDGSPNFAAVIAGINSMSRVLNNAEFATRTFGGFEPAQGTFNDTGVLGPVASGGVPSFAPDGVLIEPFDMFGIKIQVVQPATGVEFNVRPGIADESVLLYGGPPSILTGDQVLLGADSQFTINFVSPSPYTTNTALPEDVNIDGFVSLSDALVVQNRLNLVANPLADIGVEPVGASLDVNADGNLSAADSHEILNRLFEQQGNSLDTSTDNLLQLNVDAVSLSGESLLDENRVLNIPIGDEFFVEFSYEDLRPETARLGAYSVFADLSVSNTNALSVPSGSTFAESLLAGSNYSLSRDTSLQSSTTDTYDELGGIGPVSSSGLGTATGKQQVMQFRVVASEKANDVSFELNPSELETLLYGRAIPVENSQIVFGPTSRFTANIVSAPINATDDSITIAEDSGSVTIDVLANDFIPVGDSATVSIATPPSSGTATLSGNILAYTPAANFAGTDVFTYQVTGTNGNTTTANVTLTVTPINDPPIAVSDEFAGTEDTTFTVPVATLLENDFDPDDGDTLSFDGIAEVEDGTASFDGTTLTFVPEDNFFGIGAVRYFISDSAGLRTLAELLVDFAPVNDPPVTTPDSFRTDPNVSVQITVNQLLLNDSPGPEESTQQLSVISVATTTDGVTVTLTDGVITYSPPTDFRGEDSFTYTVTDGALTATETVFVDVTFQLDSVILTLPERATNNILVQRNGDDLEIIDQTDDSFLIKRPLDSVLGLTVNGRDESADTITLLFAAEDTVSYIPGLTTFSGGIGNRDHLVIQTESNISAFLNSANEDLASLLLIGLADETGSRDNFATGFESLTFSGLQHLQVLPDRALHIANGQLNISSATPVELGFLTTLDGGTISSTTPLTLRAGQSLVGSGTVAARVAADVGSLIEATGDLTLGDAESVSGFVTQGDLVTNSHTVTLLDSDQAVLGSLTSLGSSDSPGSIVADGGLLADFGSNVVGFGTLDTPNALEKPVLNNGLIDGESTDRPITLTGFVKGVGRLNDVLIDGTASPGLSPAISRNGSVTFGSGALLQVELGGSNAGSGYDQVRFDPIASLGGILDVSLIDNFLPAVGETFQILAATELLSGDFSSINLPTLPNGLTWAVERALNQINLGVELDVAGLDGFVSVSIVDGRFVVSSRDGNPIAASGTTLSIQANPENQFDSPENWTIVTTEVVDNERVIVASNGDLTLRISGTGWTNFLAPSDIDGSGNTSALDALNIIAELNSPRYSEAFDLFDPVAELEFPNLFYDANADGRVTAADALLVINRLFLQSLGQQTAEGESTLPIVSDSIRPSQGTIKPAERLIAEEQSVPTSTSLDQALASWEPDDSQFRVYAAIESMIDSSLDEDEAIDLTLDLLSDRG